MGLLEYAPEPDLLFVFGGGPDGLADHGEHSKPAHSCHLYSCRLEVPGRAVLPPAQPRRIRLETSADTVRLTWPAEGGTRYYIYRGEADPIPGRYQKIATVAGGDYVDRNAPSGRVYAYQVTRAGLTGPRSRPAFTQPARPVGLEASVESADLVVLRWRANDEPDVVGYHLYGADGPEAEAEPGRRLTEKPSVPCEFEDRSVNLADGVIRTYRVTAVNRFGVESGHSPAAYTVPDPVLGLRVATGTARSNGVGVWQRYAVTWDWPDHVKVTGFNVYHATEHIDTVLHEGGYEAFWKLWTKLNEEPLFGTQYVFAIPPGQPLNHYFCVEAVNTLGQPGFRSDIMSPTDRRFRP
jgi:hypothetical protein